MKLLLVFALLALICAARTAPTTTAARELILPEYGTDDDEQHVDIKPTDDDDDDDDEESIWDAETKTSPTTSTTTTARSTFVFPTRNRYMIPSRRPPFTQRTSSFRTTTELQADDQTENTPVYDGDFKYIRDFRKYVQQLLEDIKKLVRNLTGYDFGKTIQQPSYNQGADEH